MVVKEIIVNAGELEKRVATLENGRLMELDIEREPKIVGNVYKAKVTKVLKGMDAAFLEIGTDKNAFIAASDAVPEDGEEPHRHRIIPPITDILHEGQEILVQVMRAPLGSKGARVTTKISLPGRYTVLMLNNGTHIGVSRKIVDTSERRRLKDIANSIVREPYSLIIRTEAEGKDEDELRSDMELLLEIAERIEKQAKGSRGAGLIHDDMTLVYRLIRDDFTRDVSRLVIDNEDVYNDIVELLERSAPEMKERVVLYTAEMPVFHAYNIEQEIERTLRRKVWLPSGGSLIIDQAEALTAIDVNTGKFVGTAGLADTTFTTNLQAAVEVARQLRLRDLGGIIVIDFIDMDSESHREEVINTFENALKRDRAKIKIHQISSLGLVEMTRKRTGESLTAMLTMPCPYCSGIGRLQNMTTMALKIEREIAKEFMLHPDTEGFMLTAHPRVVATLLGYNGEAHRDLEEYLGRPVYLRAKEHYHPNSYQLEKLTLEQALSITTNLEENTVYEAKVVNTDPTISHDPLAVVGDIFVTVKDLLAPIGSTVKLRITSSGTSFAIAKPQNEKDQTIKSGKFMPNAAPPELFRRELLPEYLKDERCETPPSGLPLISPTAEGIGIFGKESTQNSRYYKQYLQDELKRNNKKSRRKQRTQLLGENEEIVPLQIEIEGDKEIIVHTDDSQEVEIIEPRESANARRRRRRRNKQKSLKATEELRTEDAIPTENISSETAIETASEKPTDNTEVKNNTTKKHGRNKRQTNRGKADISEATENTAPLPTAVKTEESPVSTTLEKPRQRNKSIENTETADMSADKTENEKTINDNAASRSRNRRNWKTEEHTAKEQTTMKFTASDDSSQVPKTNEEVKIAPRRGRGNKKTEEKPIHNNEVNDGNVSVAAPQLNEEKKSTPRRGKQKNNTKPSSVIPDKDNVTEEKAKSKATNKKTVKSHLNSEKNAADNTNITKNTEVKVEEVKPKNRVRAKKIDETKVSSDLNSAAVIEEKSKPVQKTRRSKTENKNVEATLKTVEVQTDNEPQKPKRSRK